MTYGVVPTGYNRKPLPVILSEIEQSVTTEFGPNVVQTSQSPLGQINGLMADLVSILWELGQDIYQSFDVDQAEGRRLEVLAKLRLLRRALNESDESFRKALTNQGRARIDIPDMVRAVAGLAGVTYTQIFVNDSAEIDERRLPPGTICAAVLGGDDEEIAATLRQYIVPGISTYGNTQVTATIDGYCRSMLILRPILVPVKLTIRVRVNRDATGCPPPSMLAIRDGFLQECLTGEKKLINGDNIDYFRTRSIIEARYPNVEVVSFQGERDGIAGGPLTPVDIAFIELATLAASDVIVELA